MIWLSSISQLQYYSTVPGIPCYCEILVYPNDLYLQGQFPASSGTYTLNIYTYSADGLTEYEDVTSKFSYYFAQNPVTYRHFFNARLNAYANSMCQYLCWILRAVVTDTASGQIVFDSYTERYCQSSCCDLAREIEGGQEGIGAEYQTTIGDPGSTTVTTLSFPKQTECGDPIITISAVSPCTDLEGNYFGTPTTVYSGSATFNYALISNFRGRIVKRPRTIERTYSFNCRLQRVEAQRVYALEGFEHFPQWKADEIETQLANKTIFIDGVQYEYNGGTPFSMANNCHNIFRLQAEMSDCIQRKVYGCQDGCITLNYDGAMMMYVVPEGYADGFFYDENGALIAEDYEGLLNYFRNLDGVYELNELATSPLSCEVYGAFSISGYGYIPVSFYYDFPIPTNRIYGEVLEAAEDICVPAPCPIPSTDYYYVEDQICATPETDYYYVENQTTDLFTVVGYGDWQDDGASEGTVANGIATLTLSLINLNQTEDPSSPAAPVEIPSQVVAVIGGNGRPDIGLPFNSDNSELTGDNQLYIDTNGFVYYFGEATDATPTQITLVLTVSYNLINAT